MIFQFVYSINQSYFLKLINYEIRFDNINFLFLLKFLLFTRYLLPVL